MVLTDSDSPGRLTTLARDAPRTVQVVAEPRGVRVTWSIRESAGGTAAWRWRVRLGTARALEQDVAAAIDRHQRLTAQRGSMRRSSSAWASISVVTPPDPRRMASFAASSQALPISA